MTGFAVLRQRDWPVRFCPSRAAARGLAIDRTISSPLHVAWLQAQKSDLFQEVLP